MVPADSNGASPKDWRTGNSTAAPHRAAIRLHMTMPHAQAHHAGLPPDGLRRPLDMKQTSFICRGLTMCKQLAVTALRFADSPSLYYIRIETAQRRAQASIRTYEGFPVWVMYVVRCRKLWNMRCSKLCCRVRSLCRSRTAKFTQRCVKMVSK